MPIHQIIQAYYEAPNHSWEAWPTQGPKALEDKLAQDRSPDPPIFVVNNILVHVAYITTPLLHSFPNRSHKARPTRSPCRRHHAAPVETSQSGDTQMSPEGLSSGLQAALSYRPLNNWQPTSAFNIRVLRRIEGVSWMLPTWQYGGRSNNHLHPNDAQRALIWSHLPTPGSPPHVLSWV